MLKFLKDRKYKKCTNFDAMIFAWQIVKGKQLNISELKTGIKPICSISHFEQLVLYHFMYRCVQHHTILLLLIILIIIM